ncbi:hypothetical protein CXB51_026175 [Gossypium anomalum]|uniref:Uncharacterized protein n=1 Tax=Gossypium anomalum TaxID=47600 RepID=A0A8J5YHD3_9ROSI|nr:hypothetical protein CXB51_026175 [Gossypium anomalum]
MEKMINKRTYNHFVAFGTFEHRLRPSTRKETDSGLDGSDGAEACHVGTSGVRGADLQALDVPTKHVGGGSG